MRPHGTLPDKITDVSVCQVKGATAYCGKVRGPACILKDIHEPIKGTGIERTFPNLLSREGARGQEYEGGSLSPNHACVLPYTRLLSGGMDYTSGILDLQNPTKPILTTLSRQLAYFVVIYSGMQMAADRPNIYENRFPKLYKFIQIVPTNFEKTIPLAGEIGEYYIVARKDRNSEDWYVGGVNDHNPRTVHLNLEFLEQGEYNAEIYRDSDDAHFRDNPFGHNIELKRVSKSNAITIKMAPGGGFAIHLLGKGVPAQVIKTIVSTSAFAKILCILTYSFFTVLISETV